MSNRINETQSQLNEVVGIMKTNVERVLERENKLNDLDDRATALQNGAMQFKTHSTKLKKKYWLKNLKFKIIIGLFGLAFVTLLLYWAFGSSDKSA